MASPRDVSSAFEAALEPSNRPSFVLRLYVAGTTSQSTRAIIQLKEICEAHLTGRYSLEVVDIYQQPALAKDEQIVAVPTLIRKLPLPLRRIIGDLSSEERVLVGLDLQTTRTSTSTDKRRTRTDPKPYAKKTVTKHRSPR
jgi:circadian clock protein KaiB